MTLDTPIDPSMNLPPRRPGGLTALAVLNIVFALLGALSGLMMNAMNHDRGEFDRTADNMDYVAEHSSMNSAGGNPDFNRAMAHGMAQQMRNSSPEAFRWMMLTGYLGGILLLVSGFGFLGQKRYSGRYAGIAAGVALVACGGIAMMKLGFLFWGFPMLGAGYAIVMLLLVQFAYRPTLQR